MGLSGILIAVVGIVLLISLLIYGIKIFASPSRIQHKYAHSDEKKNIFIKKYKEADIESYRGPAIRLGFIAVLTLVIMVFNYAKPAPENKAVFKYHEDEIIEQDIPVTKQTVPQLPPPPPPPPQIVVVQDERVIENEAVFEDAEVNLDDAIEVFYDTTSNIAVEVEAAPDETDYEEPEIFIVVEQQPEFPGGEGALLAYLSSNIHYPAVAMENGIEGTVVLRFVVNERGDISDIVVLKGIGGGCSEEAVRVVDGMPIWKPGRQRGRNVKVYYTLPVRFKLM